MHLIQSSALLYAIVVCLSGLSVCNVEVPWSAGYVGWVTSKVITWIISLDIIIIIIVIVLVY